MRRSLLTPALQAKLMARVADGSTLVKAAQSVGISQPTLTRWLSDERPAFRAFRASVVNARSLALSRQITEQMQATAARRKAASEECLEKIRKVRDGFVNRTPFRETAAALRISRTTEWRFRDVLGLGDGRWSRTRIEGADQRLALCRQIVDSYALGFKAEDREVFRMAVVLGLETGRRWESTGVVTGRRDTKATLMEVRP